jgi:hypothetical protein
MSSLVKTLARVLVSLMAITIAKELGMSSLDPKDAIPDYSGLNEAQRKTLDQWEGFFEKVCCLRTFISPEHALTYLSDTTSLARSPRSCRST